MVSAGSARGNDWALQPADASIVIDSNRKLSGDTPPCKICDRFLVLSRPNKNAKLDENTSETLIIHILVRLDKVG